MVKPLIRVDDIQCKKHSFSFKQVYEEAETFNAVHKPMLYVFPFRSSYINT